MKRVLRRIIIVGISFTLLIPPHIDAQQISFTGIKKDSIDFIEHQTENSIAIALKAVPIGKLANVFEHAQIKELFKSVEDMLNNAKKSKKASFGILFKKKAKKICKLPISIDEFDLFTYDASAIQQGGNLIMAYKKLNKVPPKYTINRNKEMLEFLMLPRFLVMIPDDIPKFGKLAGWARLCPFTMTINELVSTLPIDNERYKQNFYELLFEIFKTKHARKLNDFDGKSVQDSFNWGDITIGEIFLGLIPRYAEGYDHSRNDGKA